MGEPDIMDTWATSSLTPRSRPAGEPTRTSTPAPSRWTSSTAHDIIRTWLFSTVVRAHFDADTIPWKNWRSAAGSRSRSQEDVEVKGNVVVPTELLEQYGLTPFATGRRRPPRHRHGVRRRPDEDRSTPSIKLLNASKFVLGFGDTSRASTRARSPMPLTSRCSTAWRSCRRGDRSVRWLRLRPVTRTHGVLFLVVHRQLHGAGQGPLLRRVRRRARRRPSALRMALSTLHRLFAPFLPFVTEEVWSWWQDGSIHRTAWPTAAELHEPAAGTDSAACDVATNALVIVRRERGEAQARTAA